MFKLSNIDAYYVVRQIKYIKLLNIYESINTWYLNNIFFILFVFQREVHDKADIAWTFVKYQIYSSCWDNIQLWLVSLNITHLNKFWYSTKVQAIAT